MVQSDRLKLGNGLNMFQNSIVEGYPSNNDTRSKKPLHIKNWEMNHDIALFENKYSRSQQFVVQLIEVSIYC